MAGTLIGVGAIIGGRLSTREKRRAPVADRESDAAARHAAMPSMDVEVRPESIGDSSNAI
jgi:hypothetical protein